MSKPKCVKNMSIICPKHVQTPNVPKNMSIICPNFGHICSIFALKMMCPKCVQHFGHILDTSFNMEKWQKCVQNVSKIEHIMEIFWTHFVSFIKSQFELYHETYLETTGHTGWNLVTTCDSRIHLFLPAANNKIFFYPIYSLNHNFTGSLAPKILIDDC